jgi:hypothetical protein
LLSVAAASGRFLLISKNVSILEKSAQVSINPVRSESKAQTVKFPMPPALFCQSSGIACQNIM